MIQRTLTRIALVLAGAFALTVAVPTSACDCEGRAKVAATTEGAPVAAADEGGTKELGPCACQEATVPAARPEASAATSAPALDLQFWWTKPPGDGC